MKNSLPPVLSVIVPAYNAEKTLRKCVDSLLDQNNELIEIIISNDGSTDNTQHIIDEYSASYPCVHCISDDNGGVCCARNRAIKKATGRWITFVDSDDYISPDIYNKIINVLTEQNPDLLEYQLIYSTNSGDYEASPNKLPKNTLLGLDYITNIIIPVALNLSEKKEYFIESYSCNKIYKANIIHNNNILFDESRRKWEDRLFTLEFLQYTTTYYSMSEYGYHYVCGTGSSLSSKFETDILRIIMDSYRKYLKMYGHKYNFDNSFTIKYFCNLLINVAQDQFSYQVDSTVLKNMFTIFLDDDQVKHLFLSCDNPDSSKAKIHTAVLHGTLDDIYNALKQYASFLRKKESILKAYSLTQHYLSKIKQLFFSKL